MKIKKQKKKRYKKISSNNSTLKWLLYVFILTFLLSLTFSYISSQTIKNLSIPLAFLMLILVITIGVIFDVIGVAVTIASENEFHAKASKKLKGAKTAVKLIRNSHKVSNFCADVIGDIAGVLSGAISALIALKITDLYTLNFNIQFLISALVASLTVGGKAIGKTIAKKYNAKIVNLVSKFLHFFKKS